MNILDSLLNINFSSGREGHSIKNIILHTMSGTVNDRDAFFRNPDAKVSVHYGIRLDGNIRHWVSESDIAWQTDNNLANMQAIGIMLEDNGNPTDSIRTDVLYNACAELVADLCQRYGIPCKLVGVDYNHMPVESGIVLHNQVSLSPIECPAGLDSNRIVNQAQSILEPPAPEPPKPVDYQPLPELKKMRVKDMANGGAELWDLTFRAWADVKSVQHLNAGDEFDAVAIAHHPLGGQYYMTAEDYDNSGQSNVPYRAQGANVDDLEDMPEETQTTVEQQQQEQVTEPTSEDVDAPNPEPTATLEIPAAPELSQETISEPVSEPEQEQVSEPEQTSESEQESQLTTDASQEQTHEPTPPTPQITYSELPTPLDFVTNKAPTKVYDLDTDTFAKITAIKEVAEGAPFTAVSKATVVDGDVTTYYYVDDQSFSINSDDLTPAPEKEADPSIPAEHEQTMVTDPPASENKNEETPSIVPEPLDLNKQFNYREFPDGPKLFHGVGTTNIDDLNPVNPKPQQALLDKQPIMIQGAFQLMA